MDVLIADDSPASRRLLEMTLTRQGYKVVTTRDGEEAWKIVQQEDTPRMAVLDWEMPKLNGVELCRKIKNRKDAPFTYVILLTSKTKKDDIVEGLDAGADDYITKPFHSNELKSRLAAGLRILEYEATLAGKNKELSKYANQMEELAEGRAKQLVHADRMASLGVMSAGIAHEINNPLTFISNNVQILQKFMEKILPRLKEIVEKESDSKAKKQLEFILEDIPKSLEGAQHGVERITRIVKSLAVYSRKDQGNKNLCSMNDRIDQALVLCHNILKYHVTVEKQFDNNLPLIKANAPQLEQVFINLFINAAHAMENKGQGILKISTCTKNDHVYTEVEDTGPGIPEDSLNHIWDSFYTTKGVGKGTGLGLSISKEIIDDHDGSIRAENRTEGGARFIIEIPCKG